MTVVGDCATADLSMVREAVGYSDGGNDEGWGSYRNTVMRDRMSAGLFAPGRVSVIEP